MLTRFLVLRHRLFCSLLVLLGLGQPVAGVAQSPRPAKIQVMVVGSDHLSQLYNQQPASDVFSLKKQAELAKLRAQLARFRQVILMEAEPKEQPQIDSLYALYQKGLLQVESLPYGRSERYQISFALARQLQLQPQGG